MTTWLKKLRLYLLRKELKSIRQSLFKTDADKNPFTWVALYDQRADILNRIAEIEKSLANNQ